MTRGTRLVTRGDEGNETGNEGNKNKNETEHENETVREIVAGSHCGPLMCSLHQETPFSSVVNQKLYRVCSTM